MSARIIKGILVDVEAKKIKEFELAYSGLDVLYKVLKCDTIDVITRRIGAKTFDIYLDDCGLLKLSNIPSAISIDYREQLVGNLFICHHDASGNIQSLSDHEIEYILQSEMTMAHVTRGVSYNVIRYSFVGASR